MKCQGNLAHRDLDLWWMILKSLHSPNIVQTCLCYWYASDMLVICTSLMHGSLNMPLQQSSHKHEYRRPFWRHFCDVIAAVGAVNIFSLHNMVCNFHINKQIEAVKLFRQIQNGHHFDPLIDFTSEFSLDLSIELAVCYEFWKYLSHVLLPKLASLYIYSNIWSAFDPGDIVAQLIFHRTTAWKICDIFNSSPPSAAHMRRWIDLALVQIWLLVYSAPSHYLNQC